MSEVIDTHNSSSCIHSSPTPTRDAAVTPAPHSASKKPRIRFNASLDLLLCKAVLETGAHAPPVHGKTKLMAQTCEIFLRALPARIRDQYAEPKGKTVYDRFELLVKNRRSEDKKTAAASGISEERMEMHELLDDMILQRDELYETRRKDREERTASDKRLDDAGKEVRSRAMSRMSSEMDEVSSTDGGTSKKARKVVTLESDDEELELLRESIKERRENELKRMKIEEARLNLDRQRADEEREKTKRKQDLEKKRLEIEEGKLELERQKVIVELAERKAGVEERKSMVNVLESLAKKLE